MDNIEIERKWRMDAFPEGPYSGEVIQRQGYLSYGPAVRLRKTETISPTGVPAGYWLTIKGGGTLSRTEVELPLTAGQFEALWQLLPGPGATKRLRRYPLPGGHQLECSLVDEGEPDAFYYAEVEFESEAAAAAFQPPAWFGPEMTEDAGFSMAAYCRGKQQKR